MSDPVTEPKRQISIPLDFPVDEKTKDGDRTHSSLTMKRPRTKHVKKLVALLGADFPAKLFGAAGTGKAADAAADKAAAEALALLTEPERLDGLTEILADMCGVAATVIDDLDPMDLVAVGRATLDFFPALMSAFASQSS
ncbi:phage tail assembly protein, partial [Stappia stellulata]|uniref:phage tail assembly protein n=1 Tax=Stappia stellulata TaxID=71235 RepID=UPI0003F4E145